MARSFIIQNSDVKTADVYGIALMPINNDYSPVLSGYSIVMGSSDLIGVVYAPISLQIPGTISLRTTTISYTLTTGGNE